MYILYIYVHTYNLFNVCTTYKNIKNAFQFIQIYLKKLLTSEIKWGDFF